MNIRYRFLLLVLGCLSVFISDKIEATVLILTHAFNKPEFIWWQEASLRKFLKDDYTFIIFNDAPNQDLYDKINQVCQELNITCIDVPQEIHDYKNPYLPALMPRHPLGDPSAECAETIQYMLDTIGFKHPGITVILDSDMFPIREVSIEALLENYEVAAHPQYRQGKNEFINYFLPNLIFFNMETLQDKYSINFNLGIIDDVCVDTGGYTYFYIKEHPSLKWLRTNCVYTLHENSPKDILDYFQSHPKMYQLMTEKKYDFEFYADYTFIHFRAGSNWSHIDKNSYLNKLNCFFEGLSDILGNQS